MTDENSRFSPVSQQARAIVCITLLEQVMALLSAAGREAPRGMEINKDVVAMNRRIEAMQRELLPTADAEGKQS